MSKPLNRIKVVEAAMRAFAPAGGAILSDHVADVVKVELPTGGPLRDLQTGLPHDIALKVLYLASDASRFVTGPIMRPDHGVAMP